MRQEEEEQGIQFTERKKAKNIKAARRKEHHKQTKTISDEEGKKENEGERNVCVCLCVIVLLSAE